MPTATKSRRVKSVGLTNRVDFEVAVDRITWITTELRRLEAMRDAAVLRAQATHSEQIAELSEEMNGKLALCEKFADAHRETLLPEDTKSHETNHSTYGWRMGNPTLALLAKWSWKKVLAALTTNHLGPYIRQKPEVNKEAILADGKKDGKLHLPDEGGGGAEFSLSQFGLRIAQDESFFIEAKVDGAEPVKGGAS